jgi:pimeloyl-ACP methyl ester carboxylesterase
MIDYILKLTGEDDLDYIGHSMGTTAFFVGMSVKPEYNRRIKTMVALGPAVFMEDMKSPLRYLAPFSSIEKVHSAPCYYCGLSQIYINISVCRLQLFSTLT